MMQLDEVHSTKWHELMAFIWIKFDKLKPLSIIIHSSTAPQIHKLYIDVLWTSNQINWDRANLLLHMYD